MNNAEFLQEFIDEAKTHLEVIESGIIELETAQSDMELINQIFRAVHSIKGTAGFFELKNIVELAHHIENHFGDLRNNKVTLDEHSIDVLLKSFDTLKDLVENVHASEDADIRQLVQKLQTLFKDENTTEAVTKSDEPVVAESETLIRSDESVALPVTPSEEVSVTDEKPVDTVVHRSEVLQNMTQDSKIEKETMNDAQDKANKEEKEIQDKMTGAKKSSAEESIRVNVSLLNNILNLASELVLGRNQLMRVTEKHRKDVPNIEGVLQNIDHITTELQEKVMQTRMQPLGTIFNKFPRVVRDLSKKLQKDVELVMEGSEVELDKSIIESLADPLTHLLRNALDHGIEDIKTRKESGKDLKGKVGLNAYHEGGYVIIDVTDDGAGVSVAKIKKKVLEHRLATTNELENMADNEIIKFLFHAGLSTAEKITDVSGRGVGMDVVKNNIEKLGGNIEIITSLGKGTTFRLMLPLTLAIISAIIVQVRDEKFALPQINLQEIVRIKQQDSARKIEYINQSEVLRLRGKLLPIVRMSHLLKLERDKNNSLNYKDIISSSLMHQEPVTRVLVIKIGSRRFGIAVDEIHGSEEILVKPLPSYIKNIKTYSGVTILGDGRVAMILDPDGIMNKANLNNFEDQHSETNLRNELREFEKQNMLIFKCSGVEQLAIDIAMVKRIEEINTEDIEVISGKEFMKYLDQSIPLYRPENVLPNFSKKEIHGKAYVIIPRMTENPMGILISKVIDTSNMHVEFVNADKPPEGLLGSILVGKKIVSVLNMFYLFEKVIPDYVKASITEEERLNNRILLVEDTPFFQRIVKDFLVSVGFTVDVAQHGKEGFEKLEEEKYDLVVCDIQMPVMDGLEFTKKVRNDERFSKIPIVGLTSMTGERNKKIGIEAGFDAYQYKLHKQELLQVVKVMLNKKEDKDG